MKTGKKKAAPIAPTPVVPIFRPVDKSEKPDIYADRLSRLTPEQRAELRAMIASPLFVHFLRIVAVFKPSSNCTNCGSGARDAFSDARANARLGEIRGWEMYETAIFLALNEPLQIKQAAVESFQAPDAEWNKAPDATSDAAKK